VKSTPAHEVANRDLLAIMPSGASRVVEPGCSAGALAREYRAAHPACDYVGIEVDAAYAELARRHCSRVLIADLERMTDAQLDLLAPADCWVFGDVLEHLVDPWRLLTRVRPRLAPGGCVVACVPNMQHWSVIARLARGELFYEDWGLLDRTHLRWFTRATLMQLFEGAGFRVIGLRGRRVDEHPQTTWMIAPVRQCAEALGLAPDVAERDTAVLQWLVRAVPTSGA
jgi:trans-aconitate methyltransferase